MTEAAEPRELPRTPVNAASVAIVAITEGCPQPDGGQCLPAARTTHACTRPGRFGATIQIERKLPWVARLLANQL
jgi:hypothetical protein